MKRRRSHAAPRVHAPASDKGIQRGEGAGGVILLLAVEVVLAHAPQHREEDALAAVGDDLGDEAAEEQPGDAVLGDGGGQG